MYTLYKFHFLNGISEINQLFDDILIIWPAPLYIYIIIIFILHNYYYFNFNNYFTEFNILYMMNIFIFILNVDINI